MDIPISKGFLYGLWNGQLKIKEGTVLENNWRRDRHAIFRFGKRDGDWSRCSPEPEELMHARLWLPERDDAKACKILIGYYEEAIKRHEKQIEGYRENIRILEEGCK